MNESLQTSLAVILQKATQGITAGVDFLSAQLPDVIRQLLIYNLCKDIAVLVVTIVVWVVFGILLRKGLIWAKEQSKKDPWSEPYFSVWFIAGLSTIPMVPLSIFACSAFQDALELWLAPKVWLIEYAATLIKH